MRLFALLLVLTPLSNAVAQQAAPRSAAGRTATPSNGQGLIGLEQDGIHRPKDDPAKAKVRKDGAARPAQAPRPAAPTPTPR